MCAAGLAGSTADDVAKEVAIFRAHKATPIVIADDGDDRFAGATVIAVPSVDPALGFVLSAMVGHLFGYEAALAIDASARPLREAMEVDRAGRRRRHVGDARAARWCAAGSPARWPSSATACGPTATTATSRRPPRCSSPDCCATCAPIARSRRTRRAPARSARRRPSSTTSLLSLTRAIEELTRPVDAIKHQAKTVTVGISRSDEGVLDRALVQAVLDAGAGRDVLTYRTLKVLADLDPAVAEVVGLHPLRRSTGDTHLDRRPRRHLPADRRAVSTATRSSSAPSAASPASARCSSPAAAATGARSSSCRRSRPGRPPASPCCTCASTTA